MYERPHLGSIFIEIILGQKVKEKGIIGHLKKHYQ